MSLVPGEHLVSTDINEVAGFPKCPQIYTGVNLLVSHDAVWILFNSNV